MTPTRPIWVRWVSRKAGDFRYAESEAAPAASEVRHGRKYVANNRGASRPLGCGTPPKAGARRAPLWRGMLESRGACFPVRGRGIVEKGAWPAPAKVAFFGGMPIPQ